MADVQVRPGLPPQADRCSSRRISADDPRRRLVGPESAELDRLKVTVFLEVEGAAHYLPAYAGNLDIMTSAALRTAEAHGRADARDTAPTRPRPPRRRRLISTSRTSPCATACTRSRHSISLAHVRTSPARSTKQASTAIEVAHGDGLAGASFNYGFGAQTDAEWIAAAREVVTHAKLTTLLLPGIGTIARPAGRLWTSACAPCGSPRTAPRPTSPASTSTTARNLGMDVAGFLMMSHMAQPASARRASQAHGSYGAHCVYVTDSGGALTMTDVRDRIRAYRRDTAEPEHDQRGIHAHHNLALAVANSIVAVEEGAHRVDACLAGMGAGAGNCAAGGLHRRRRPPRLEARLRPVRADGRGRRHRPATAGPARSRRPRNPVAGICRRVLQLPAPRESAARRRTASPRVTSWSRLGRRSMVGGQEDMIVDIALDLVSPTVLANCGN